MDKGRCSFPYIAHPFFARLLLKREMTGNQYYRPKEGNVATIRTSLVLWVGWRKIHPPPAQKKNEVRNIVSTAAQRENAGQFGTDSL